MKKIYLLGTIHGTEKSKRDVEETLNKRSIDAIFTEGVEGKPSKEDWLREPLLISIMRVYFSILNKKGTEFHIIEELSKKNRIPVHNVDMSISELIQYFHKSYNLLIFFLCISLSYVAFYGFKTPLVKMLSDFVLFVFWSVAFYYLSPIVTKTKLRFIPRVIILPICIAFSFMTVYMPGAFAPFINGIFFIFCIFGFYFGYFALFKTKSIREKTFVSKTVEKMEKERYTKVLFVCGREHRQIIKERLGEKYEVTDLTR